MSIAESNASNGLFVLIIERTCALGVVLVDAHGKALFINHIAKAILLQADGITILNGELRLSHQWEAAALRRMILAATRGDPPDTGATGPCQISRPSQLRPYELAVLPLRAGEDWPLKTGTGAIVTIQDPDYPSPMQPMTLQRAYGLTPAEAGLTSEVVRGNGLKAAAAALGVSVATARTHLQHVFEKTCTHRQAELVRRVAATPYGITLERLTLNRPAGERQSASYAIS
jgi:DNA-binding CsgD family transcriptional regulator